ncbi:MAG: hypothetical protein AOA66_1621 [Candidatus Bathyarchaeota archaeon BA2]|nr:MAG: hypothetical protein AOA66_1621 [Candidatus Bathyarchaeota archaeon BA2]
MRKLCRVDIERSGEVFKKIDDYVAEARERARNSE